MKKRRLLLWVFLLAALCLSAAAEEMEIYSGLWPEGVELTARALCAVKGTAFPVYAAPFEDAARFASGKAQVSTSEPFEMLYQSPDRQWIMVRYAVSGTEGRVGWIRPPVVPADAEVFVPDRRLVRAAREVSLTDDPLGGERELARAAAGEEMICLTALEAPDGREWAYIETAVDGKTAYLFAELSALEAVPLTWVEDGILFVREGVTRIGGVSDAIWADEGEEIPGMLDSVLAPGSLCIGMLDAQEEAEWGLDERIKGLCLPRSLRCLGDNAMYYFDLEELILPEGCESVSQWAFCGCDIGRIVIPASLTEGDGLSVSGGEFFSVGSYSVAEGNPVFRDIGGVLYTADGRTLLSYPNARADTHYDVPRGTERIGDRAFSDDGGGLPLQTVSLPLGLKSIGDYAFSGCTRLISLTVPLTVKEIAENAFYDCVCLERLSLPEGLTAYKNDGSWACYNDFTYYNGDNGTSNGNSGTGDGDSGVFQCFLKAADGSGRVKLYLNPADEDPVCTLEDGTYIDSAGLKPGMTRIWVSIYDLWDLLPPSLAAGQTWTLYIDPEDRAPTAGICLFDYDAFEIVEKGGTEPFDAMSVYYGGGPFVRFYLEDWSCRDVFIGDEALRITRVSAEDGRVMGILCGQTPSGAVPLLDDGRAAVRYVYPGEQAEIVGEEGGYLRVRTGFGTYLTEKKYVRVIGPAESDSAKEGIQ